MGTTAPELAAPILEALATLGVPHAVLHGEDQVAAGSIMSDLDLVAADPPKELAARLRGVFDELGVGVIARFPYDVGAETFFLADAHGERSLQLDVMCDPRGLGRLGIRTEVALENVRAGCRWPVLSEIDSIVYLLRKRHMKRDRPRLIEQIACARSIGARVVTSRAREVCSQPASGDIEALLIGGTATPAFHYHRASLPRASRLASRLLHPVGHWVHIQGQEADAAASAVAARLGCVLPSVRLLPQPPRATRLPGLLATAIHRDRWRPHLLVSFGPAPARMADRTVDAGAGVDDIAGLVTSHMIQRVARQIYR